MAQQTNSDDQQTRFGRFVKLAFIVGLATLIFIGVVHVIEDSYSVTKEEADKLAPIPNNTSDTN